MGCRLAADITHARGEAGQINWMLTRMGLAVFLSMSVMMFSMYLYRQQVVDSPDTSQLAVQLAGLMRYLCLIFATPVLFLLGGPIIHNAMQQGRRGVWSTDALIVLGVAASFVYSYVATLRGRGDTYYETGCVILVFVTLGRWLEARGRLKASAALASLETLFPETVSVVRDGKQTQVACRDVRPGDRMFFAAGDRIAADGVIESGRAGIDEQILSGESTPVVKEPGDLVRAGTLNLDGALEVRATSVGAASTLGRLVALLEDARRSKCRYERLTERVASAFIPLTVLLAIAAAVLGMQRAGPAEAILSALAVLLIACPCALGLATPLAVWIALGRAASRHVLLRDGDALEALARIRAVCFDKTGTLTTGQPRVAQFHLSAMEAHHAERVLSVATGVARTSRHALSKAIDAYAHDTGIRPSQVSRSTTHPGRGIESTVDGLTAYLGNATLMREQRLVFDAATADALRQLEQSALGVVAVGWAGHVRALFGCAESLRPDARSAVETLRNAKLHVAVLTGDHAARGQALAKQLPAEVVSELMPEAKLEQVRLIAARHGKLAMVGDGLNDAPVLAAADVGIAMGCGADIARETAGVCLLGDDIAAVPWLIRLARRTLSTIRVNLFWAFTYNIIGIGLAMTGRLSPVFAAAAMLVSSLFVVSNSMRLTRDDDTQREGA
jgi:heavy metal translocating P-type ATPase